MTSRRVLIAEDESLIRLDLAETLAEEGYEVVGQASDGAQAIELARSLKPDVAVLDIKMPGTDGITAARVIEQENLCAVVILTAFSQAELVSEASQAGALAYVVKPFNRSDLVPAIEMAVARFADLSEARSEAAEAKDRLAERKSIDRAKGQLMDDFGMSEADAYTFIRSSAMSGRTSMGEIAKQILARELTP